MMRGIFGLVVVLGGVCGTTFAQASSFYQPTDYSFDPYGYVMPSYYSPTMWQNDPFGYGYNLIAGYRPIYSGAGRSVGYEITYTDANQNGYIYRPVYEASPGYHRTPGGALVVEYPNRYDPAAYQTTATMPLPPVAVKSPAKATAPTTTVPQTAPAPRPRKPVMVEESLPVPREF